MQRILFISGYQIFPPFTGGHIRSANVIRSLAKAGCEVRIYSLGGRRKDYKKGVGSSVSYVDGGISEYVYRGILRGFVQGVFQRLEIVHFWQTLIGQKKRPDPLLLSWMSWADTVIINHSYAYTFLRLAEQKNRIINSHNLEHHIWVNSWWKKHFIAPLIRKMEIQAARAAHAVWCCAPDEEVFYKKAHRDIKTFAVPNGVFPEQYKKNPELRTQIRAQLGIAESQRVILFVGSDYGPNREAYRFIQHFAAEHSDFLADHGLVFLIAGGVARYPSREGHLLTTGFTANILPYFHAADWAINPVTSGSGTNVKNFEYLAAHLPLLSTAFGVRGFDLEDRENFFQFGLTTLKSTLETGPLQKTAEQLGVMAQKAFHKNRALVDISLVGQNLQKASYQDA